MPDIPVVVLGGGAVGKSCLTIQYIQGHFVDRYDATIEDVYRKPVEIDGSNSVLTIVDTAGQDAFGTMREQYMKTGQGFVLVYSITDTDSFQQLKKIYAQLRRTKGEGSSIPCIVVANKLDLDAQRAVQREEGINFARQANCEFIEVSAKNRLEVEEVFTRLVRAIRVRAQGGQALGASNGAGGPSNAPGSDDRGGAGGNARLDSHGKEGHDSNRQAAPAPAPVARAPEPKPKSKSKSWKCEML